MISSSFSTVISRRAFLRGAGVALAGAWMPGLAADSGAPLASFFVIGDTHFLAEKESPDKMDPVSAACTRALVDTLNRLPGVEIPETAGGGKVAAPNGVLHAGDLIDTGDKTSPVHVAMQRTEWAAYVAEFGLTGTEGRLKFPVMEVAGNHDAPQGIGYAAEQLAVRHRSRSGLKGISKNGLHYSWNWGGAHFVALGLIVGATASEPRKRRYAAMDSLAFLQEDLASNTSKDQPLVVLHHVDVARYTAEKEGVDYGKWEWDPADVQAFYEALRGRRAVTFHGHTHKRDIQRWDGKTAKAESGIGVFNVDNGAHFGSPSQALFYVELRGDGLVIREYATRDRWATGEWTPQVWRAAI
jgi:hypothetical protein